MCLLCYRASAGLLPELGDRSCTHPYMYICIYKNKKSSIILPLCAKWRKSNPNAYIYGDWTFLTNALFLRNCLYNNLGCSLVFSVPTLRVALDARQQVSLLRGTFCVKVLMYKQAVTERCVQMFLLPENTTSLK